MSFSSREALIASDLTRISSTVDICVAGALIVGR